MASAVQRKLEFKVRKSSRIEARKCEESCVKRCHGLKELVDSDCENEPEITSIKAVSPRKRSGKDCEVSLNVRPLTCSPNKKKKEIRTLSWKIRSPSEETPMKTSTCLFTPNNTERERTTKADNYDFNVGKTSLPPSTPTKCLNTNVNFTVISPYKSPKCSLGFQRLITSPVKSPGLSLKKLSLNSPVRCHSPVKSSPVTAAASSSQLEKENTAKKAVCLPGRKSLSMLKLHRANSHAYLETKQLLHTAKPDKLQCRDKEVREIRSFLEGHLNKQTAGSLYISGAPGTGKTASLLHIIDNLKTEHSCKVSYLNCMMLKHSVAVFKKLHEELTGKKLPSNKDVTKYMEKCVTSSTKSLIIVLDEIDQLDSKNQEVLYTIFEWPSLPKSKLILVGVANALDFTDRILPRLQAKPRCRPQLMNYAPYTKDQIVKIISDRLKKLEDDGLAVIEPSAVQFCARKISAVAGDMRKALDVCRRAVELVEQDIRSQQVLKVSECNSASKSRPVVAKITVHHISRIMSEVYGSSVKSSQSEETVPLQQKLIMCSLLLLVKNGKTKEVSLGKFHETYCKICKKRQMAVVDQSEFFSLCSLLEARGMMGVKRGKETRLAKVVLKLDETELEHTLQDRVLMSSMLHDGLPK